MVDRSMGYEEDNVKAKPPLVVGAVLVVVVVISFLTCCYMFEELMKWSRAQDEDVSVLHGARDLPPHPRLEANPGVSLKALRAKEKAMLEEYRAGKSDGLAQIPVERAIHYFLLQSPGVRSEPRVAPEKPPLAQEENKEVVEGEAPASPGAPEQ